mgnify:CR=1 FL=1
MANTLSGFGYFFRGMGLLTRPGLRLFVVIPLLANIAVFALMAGAIYQALSGLYIEYSSNFIGDWEFLAWIVMGMELMVMIEKGGEVGVENLS